MRALFINILLFFSSSCFAVNMLEDGSMWVYWDNFIYQDKSTGEDVTVSTNSLYYVNGESVIEGKRYKDIWCCRRYYNPETDRWEYHRHYCASFREEEGRVYSRCDVYRSTNLFMDDFSFMTDDVIQVGDEYLIYDFNREQGTLNIVDRKGNVLQAYQTVIPYVGDRHSLLFPLLYESSFTVRRYMTKELLLYYRGGKLAWENSQLDKDQYVVYSDMQAEIDRYLTNYMNVGDANNSSRFLHEGNVWTYTNLCYNEDGKDVMTAWYYKYFVNGHCEINGKQYVNLWRASFGYITDRHPLYKEQASSPYFDYIDVMNKMHFCDTATVSYHYVMSMCEEDNRIYVQNRIYLNSYKVEMIDGNIPSMFNNYWQTDLYDDFVLYDFATENDSIIPYVGNKYSLLYFFVDNGHPIQGPIGQHRNEWTGTKVTQHERLNLFYRDGKLEYKSPDFYPDPFFPEETADGIMENVKIEKFKNERAVFNLQGQRINGLRKGLNIVDGKKIFVK